MTITSVSSTTFLSDAINLITNKLASINGLDPIPEKRALTERFVLTAYPQRPVTYPIITVVDRGISQPQRLGMGSEGTAINLNIEIRIWARNVKERDEIFDSIYDYLRTNQLDDTTGLVASNLDGFKLTSAVNIDEPGEAGVKSKVMEVRFLFLAE